jgi:hypothetical protein
MQLFRPHTDDDQCRILKGMRSVGRGIHAKRPVNGPLATKNQSTAKQYSAFLAKSEPETLKNLANT